MTVSKQQDTRPSIPPPLLSYGHHLGISTLKSSQEHSSMSSLPTNTLSSLHSPYSASSSSPTELGITNNNSQHNRNANGALTNNNQTLGSGSDRIMRPTLMSPTPSPSSNTNIPKPHIPFSQPTESLVDPNSPNHSAYRPLNVTDALAYLDLVKNRFSDKPDVYNQFLDIMKDFKSQAIDTPGVIKRVSTLFKGHPELISGFNTFLPSGYRIECSVDPRDPHCIIVITPNETMTINSSHELKQENHYSSLPPPIQSSATLPPLPPLPLPAATTAAAAVVSSRPSLMSSNSNSSFNHPQHIPTANSPYPSIQKNTPSNPTTEKRPPIEFNHAINYVNRIKNRFAHHPDVYKQFLEILQTYQKEQKPIGEVYAHVRYLFQGADDLLDEFKQFLPEIMDGSSFGASQSHGLKRQHTSSSSSPVKKKKTYITKKSRAAFAMENGADSHSHNNKKASQRHDYHQIDEGRISPELSSFSFDPQRPNVSSTEVLLFDKIKKHIGNKPSYDEFLKLLSLYTQQIVDLNVLVMQVKRFIGQDKELFDAFKMVIAYDPEEHPIERPPVSTPKPDLNHCKTIKSSPSYRAVPRDWQNQPCSGRDQMCWEVLNDEYVSHPIWASEDSTVITSKRNIHEEALHRCEEERYDYDVNIEANQSSIALLRPIALQIEQMSPEEKDAMRLEPGLGGPTVSVYERIIKKIYDDERGNEIIQMLYQSPASVVPVLLNRLQLKDQEWKKAQKEWNKIWRDQDDKNFYKSLDYQSNSFKVNDKKSLSNKALVTEIETKQSRHTEAVFEEPALLKDVSSLVFSFVDSQNGFTKEDKQKVKRFICSFTSLFFGIETETDQPPCFDDSDTDMSLDISLDNTDSTIQASKSTSLSPAESKENNVSLDLFATAAAFTAPDQEDMLYDKKYGTPFYCNSNYYCLFRLYQVLFERLYQFKSLGNKIKADPDSLGKKFNRIAKELDLVTTRFDDIDLSKGYYEAAVEIIEQFFKGGYDQNTFEENLRYVFGINAYIMFTIDKLLYSFIKQIQTVSTDKKSVQLLRSYQELKHKSDGKTIVAYRDKVANLLGPDENMYQIDIDKETHQMDIHLLDNKNSHSNDKTIPKHRAYKEYLTSYVDWMNPTKGIDQSQLNPTFLSRTLRPNDNHFKYACIQSQLRYKIQEETYHMYYIIGSEDILCRKPLVNASQEDANCKWKQWISSKGNDDLSVQARALLA